MILHFLCRGGGVALAFALLALIFGFLWAREDIAARALDDHGLVATATLESKHTERHIRRTNHRRRIETSYFGTFVFDAAQPDGTTRPQRIDHAITRQDYEDLPMGHSLQVRYLPENPARADVFAGEARGQAGVMRWFALGFLLAAGLFGAPALRAAQRAHRLDEDGVSTDGTVESVRQSRSGAVLSLRFRDSGGTERRATASALRDPAWAEARPGTPVRLVYDPRDPSNVVLV